MQVYVVAQRKVISDKFLFFCIAWFYYTSHIYFSTRSTSGRDVYYQFDVGNVQNMAHLTVVVHYWPQCSSMSIKIMLSVLSGHHNWLWNIL